MVISCASRDVKMRIRTACCHSVIVRGDAGAAARCLDTAEQAVIFVIGASSEEQHVRGLTPGEIAVAERESPEPVDGDPFMILSAQRSKQLAGGNIEGIYAAVAKVADKQRV